MRGVGRVTCSVLDSSKFRKLLGQVEDSLDKKYFLVSIYDLTYENEIIQKNAEAILAKDKLLKEMDEFLRLLQKICMVRSLDESIQIYTKYLLQPDILFAAHIQGSNLSIIGEVDPSQKKEIDFLSEEIKKYLLQNKISRYTSMKFHSESTGHTYYVVFIRFEMANSKAFSVFVFSDQNQLEKFKHQSAIALAEQLSTVLNNIALKEAVITDGLTQLRNSMYFRNRLNSVCSSSKQAQLILLDVDHFKKINDDYGHLCGDIVLTKIGHLLKLIEQDYNLKLNIKVNSDLAITCARVGGEEFAILLPEINEKEAILIAEDLREKIQNLVINYQSVDVRFTISLGLSSWIRPNRMSEDLVNTFFKNADEALYISKKSGRNQLNKKSA